MKIFLSLSSLHLYIIRQSLKPFALALMVLMLALSMERVLRLIDLVAADGAPVGSVFILMACLMPYYFSLALPWSFFLGILLTFRRLQDSLELTIIQSAGLSLRTLLKPVLFMSLALTFIMFLLLGYAAPYTRYSYRAILYDLSASGQILNLRPGALTDIGHDILVRADHVSRQGQYLEKVFIQSGEKNGDKILMSARNAVVERNEKSGLVTLILHDGNLIHIRQDQPPEPVIFTQYFWKMPGAAVKTYGARGRDEREMDLMELSHGGRPHIPKESGHNEEMAEFHTRLVQIFSVPLLVFLALPLALIGGGRTGKAYGVVAGIILLILYDKILGLGKAASAAGYIPPYLALWVPWCILGATGYALLRWKTPALLRLSKKHKGDL